MTRRQEVVLCLTISYDTVFYAVLVPLLPHYVEQVRLSALTAGILMGAFAARTLAGVLPGASLASRRGARTALIVGLCTTATASICFGFATSAWTLCAARLAQGVGCGIIWTGALAWLVTAAIQDRRAEVIGRALGAAVFGQLIGPACGARRHLQDLRPLRFDRVGGLRTRRRDPSPAVTAARQGAR